MSDGLLSEYSRSAQWAVLQVRAKRGKNLGKQIDDCWSKGGSAEAAAGSCAHGTSSLSDVRPAHSMTEGLPAEGEGIRGLSSDSRVWLVHAP